MLGVLAQYTQGPEFYLQHPNKKSQKIIEHHDVRKQRTAQKPNKNNGCLAQGNSKSGNYYWPNLHTTVIKHLYEI